MHVKVCTFRQDGIEVRMCLGTFVCDNAGQLAQWALPEGEPVRACKLQCAKDGSFVLPFGGNYPVEMTSLEEVYQALLEDGAVVRLELKHEVYVLMF